jgi:hypothetical protein
MAKPSFLRRLLCAIGLHAAYRTRHSDDGLTRWSECADCGQGGHLIQSGLGSIFPRFDVDVPMPVQTIAPSLDDLHPAFSEPVTGYMSRTGYELLYVRENWWTAFCLDRTELNPRGGVVEVEVRLRRVVE